jgi:tetratricopeptide (TPR) repeat protein
MTGPGVNRQRAAEAFEQALALDPQDVTAANNLANILRTQRKFARAESLYTSIARSARVSQITLGNLGGTLFNAGKIAESESVYTELRKRFPTSQGAQTYPVSFLYHRGRLDSLETFWKSRRGDPNPILRISALGNLATQSLLRGRLREARSLRMETIALNEARGVPTPPLSKKLADIGVDIWFLGRNEEGIRELEAELARTPLRSQPILQRPDLAVAQYYAWAGRPDRARTFVTEYMADVKDTAMRTNLEPSVHAIMAEIAIAEKRPLDAVREYWQADSMPDGPSSDCDMCILAPVGRAYDLASMPDSAIAIWERYIAAPYVGRINQDATFLAGIRKRLGELYEAKGDTQRAATHYMAFLELWKNADPELQPQVAEVRKRLARLKDIAGK